MNPITPVSSVKPVTLALDESNILYLLQNKYSLTFEGVNKVPKIIIRGQKCTITSVNAELEKDVGTDSPKFIKDKFGNLFTKIHWQIVVSDGSKSHTIKHTQNFYTQINAPKDDETAVKAKDWAAWQVTAYITALKMPLSTASDFVWREKETVKKLAADCLQVERPGGNDIKTKRFIIRTSGEGQQRLEINLLQFKVDASKGQVYNIDKVHARGVKLQSIASNVRQLSEEIIIDSGLKEVTNPVHVTLEKSFSMRDPKERTQLLDRLGNEPEQTSKYIQYLKGRVQKDQSMFSNFARFFSTDVSERSYWKGDAEIIFTKRPWFYGIVSCFGTYKGNSKYTLGDMGFLAELEALKGESTKGSKAASLYSHYVHLVESNFLSLLELQSSLKRKLKQLESVSDQSQTKVLAEIKKNREEIRKIAKTLLTASSKGLIQLNTVSEKDLKQYAQSFRIKTETPPEVPRPVVKPSRPPRPLRGRVTVEAPKRNTKLPRPLPPRAAVRAKLQSEAPEIFEKKSEEHKRPESMDELSPQPPKRIFPPKPPARPRAVAVSKIVEARIKEPPALVPPKPITVGKVKPIEDPAIVKQREEIREYCKDNLDRLEKLKTRELALGDKEEFLKFFTLAVNTKDFELVSKFTEHRLIFKKFMRVDDKENIKSLAQSYATHLMTEESAGDERDKGKVVAQCLSIIRGAGGNIIKNKIIKESFSGITKDPENISFMLGMLSQIDGEIFVSIYKTLPRNIKYELMQKFLEYPALIRAHNSNFSKRFHYLIMDLDHTQRTDLKNTFFEKIIKEVQRSRGQEYTSWLHDLIPEYSTNEHVKFEKMLMLFVLYGKDHLSDIEETLYKEGMTKSLRKEFGMKVLEEIERQAKSDSVITEKLRFTLFHDALKSRWARFLLSTEKFEAIVLILASNPQAKAPVNYNLDALNNLLIVKKPFPTELAKKVADKLFEQPSIKLISYIEDSEWWQKIKDLPRSEGVSYKDHLGKMKNVLESKVKKVHEAVACLFSLENLAFREFEHLPYSLRIDKNRARLMFNTLLENPSQELFEIIKKSNWYPLIQTPEISEVISKIEKRLNDGTITPVSLVNIKEVYRYYEAQHRKEIAVDYQTTEEIHSVLEDIANQLLTSDFFKEKRTDKQIKERIEEINNKRLPQEILNKIINFVYIKIISLVRDFEKEKEILSVGPENARSKSKLEKELTKRFLKNLNVIKVSLIEEGAISIIRSIKRDKAGKIQKDKLDAVSKEYREKIEGFMQHIAKNIDVPPLVKNEKDELSVNENYLFNQIDQLIKDKYDFPDGMLGKIKSFIFTQFQTCLSKKDPDFKRAKDKLASQFPISKNYFEQHMQEILEKSNFLDFHAWSALMDSTSQVPIDSESYRMADFAQYRSLFKKTKLPAEDIEISEVKRDE